MPTDREQYYFTIIESCLIHQKTLPIHKKIFATLDSFFKMTETKTASFMISFLLFSDKMGAKALKSDIQGGKI